MKLTPEEAKEINKNLPDVIMLYLYSIKDKLPDIEREHLEKIFEWKKGE